MTEKPSQNNTLVNLEASLRLALAKLYPTEAAIRRITDDAGIDSLRITFMHQAITDWHSVFTEAKNIDRVDVLLKVVESEYPDNLNFREICDAYRKSAAQPLLSLIIPKPISKPREKSPTYLIWIGGAFISCMVLVAIWFRPPVHKLVYNIVTNGLTTMGVSNAPTTSMLLVPIATTTLTALATLPTTATPTNTLISTDTFALNNTPTASSTLPPLLVGMCQ